jgi:hypothetical protein
VHAVLRSTDPVGGIVRLGHEPGNLLSMHWDRFTLYAKRQMQVELQADCYSACTLIMAAIERKNLCFGPNAALHFHQASYAAGIYAGKPAFDSTVWTTWCSTGIGSPITISCAITREQSVQRAR